MSHEHLRVYQAAQLLRGEVDTLHEGMSSRFDGAYEHLDDAIDSVCNNVAEGSASTYPGKQRHFYDIALGSSGEARNCLQALARRGAFSGKNTHKAITYTWVINKMLKALINRLPPPS
jgi:four helix bundle protein